MSMNLASDMKTTGLIGFLRLQRGGPEISLEFKGGEYSIPVTITLDGHVVTKYLSMVPVVQMEPSEPNMQLVITDKPYVPAAAVVDGVKGEVVETKTPAPSENKPSEPAPAEETKAPAAVATETKKDVETEPKSKFNVKK